MEFLGGIDLATITYVALFTFGAVNAVSIFKKDLTSQQKWFLAVVFAFVFGFIPADLGNEIANRIKDALAVGAGTSAVAGVASRIGGK